MSNGWVSRHIDAIYDIVAGFYRQYKNEIKNVSIVIEQMQVKENLIVPSSDVPLHV